MNHHLDIYSKNSDKAHLADKRCRIVRETYARSPAENKDLVFVSTATESGIPENAIYKWQNTNGDWHYTTAERCREMVSPDPSYWTQEKLKALAEVENKLWEDWWEHRVYGYVNEEWDAAARSWKHINSVWGYYGVDAIIEGVRENIDGEEGIVVCVDDSSMNDELGVKI